MLSISRELLRDFTYLGKVGRDPARRYGSIQKASTSWRPWFKRVRQNQFQ